MTVQKKLKNSWNFCLTYLSHVFLLGFLLSCNTWASFEQGEDNPILIQSSFPLELSFKLFLNQSFSYQNQSFLIRAPLSIHYRLSPAGKVRNLPLCPLICFASYSENICNFILKFHVVYKVDAFVFLTGLLVVDVLKVMKIRPLNATHHWIFFMRIVEYSVFCNRG